MEDQTMNPPWSIEKRILFRFFFIYFILYTFPFPLSALPLFEEGNFIYDLWDPLIVWTGNNILHLDYEITIKPNGSGDTTWNYVQVLLIAMISFLGSVIWSALDRKRMDYARLYSGLSILLRYYVATMMISYGLFKVIKTQFPFPYIGRLSQSYGDSSPMGLLWTFMGYSTAYNFFTGFAEFIGGFLLFFRKTRLLGCLICIGVMSNVVVLNFTYDVPVKLLSSHLLFIAIFLAAPDAKRLLDFFMLNRSTGAEVIHTHFRKTKWRYSYMVVKTLFIIFVIGSTAKMAWGYATSDWGDWSERSPLMGYFDVEMHVSNGDTIPKKDSRRWKKISLSGKSLADIQYGDSSSVYWNFTVDTLRRTIKVVSTDSTLFYDFTYKKNNNIYEWHGGDKKYSMYFRMKRKGIEEFLLVNRGFHWINERPYNR